MQHWLLICTYILQDLLSLSLDGHFESQFFSFRCKVQQLEKQLGKELGAWLHRSPSLQAQLRIMEMFQCVSHREAVRVSGDYMASNAHASLFIIIFSNQPPYTYMYIHVRTVYLSPLSSYFQSQLASNFLSSNPSTNHLPTYVSSVSPQTILTPHHRAVVATILSDIEDIAQILTTHISHPPLLPHTPPIASKLLWLHRLGERISGSMDVVRSAAPELLEGELGWKLRQTYGELTDKLQR